MHAICRYYPRPEFQTKYNYPVQGEVKFRQERGKKLQVQVNITNAGRDWLYKSDKRNSLIGGGLLFRINFHGHLGAADCSNTKGILKSNAHFGLGHLGYVELSDCNPNKHPKSGQVFDDCKARRTWEIKGQASLFGGIKSILGRAVVIRRVFTEIACCVIGVADPSKGIDPKDIKP